MSQAALDLHGTHGSRQAKKTQPLSRSSLSLPSRRLLGAVKLTPDGGDVVPPGHALPFRGKGSLRRALAAPSSRLRRPAEQGERSRHRGHVGLERQAALGAGPVVDSIEHPLPPYPWGWPSRQWRERHAFRRSRRARRARPRAMGQEVLLAGPVSAADEPFRLFSWTPRATKKIQKTHQVYNGLRASPEGLCALERGGRGGILVVYDTPSRDSDSRTAYVRTGSACQPFSRVPPLPADPSRPLGASGPTGTDLVIADQTDFKSAAYPIPATEASVLGTKRAL